MSTRCGYCPRVVPTHVGVDRGTVGRAHGPARRPHARGGGPARCCRTTAPHPSSPRTWGWTERRVVDRVVGHVVPTHVGVDRVHRPPLSRVGSRPHARGGGPGRCLYLGGRKESSPRTWGWTGRRHRPGRVLHVVPTHVGVDRRPAVRSSCASRRPHARGGGPWAYAARAIGAESSPRTWGWTAGDRTRADRGDVVPTHVGVDRTAAPAPLLQTRRPHARGGGPCSPWPHASALWSSPRTWGWTGDRATVQLHLGVVPTHVGVDRA